VDWLFDADKVNRMKNRFLSLFIILLALPCLAEHATTSNAIFSDFPKTVSTSLREVLTNHTLTMNYGTLCYPNLGYSGEKPLPGNSLITYAFRDYFTRSDIGYSRPITKNMKFKIDLKDLETITVGWELKK
jgi:hypothetical protein